MGAATTTHSHHYSLTPIHSHQLRLSNPLSTPIHSPNTPILLSTPHNYSHSLTPTTPIYFPNTLIHSPTIPIHSPNHSHTPSTLHNYSHPLPTTTSIYSPTTPILPSTPHITPVLLPNTPIHSHQLLPFIPPTTPFHSTNYTHSPPYYSHPLTVLLPPTSSTVPILLATPSLLIFTPPNYPHPVSQGKVIRMTPNANGGNSIGYSGGAVWAQVAASDWPIALEKASLVGRWILGLEMWTTGYDSTVVSHCPDNDILLAF
ncbi:uncharacterized protein [Macrobrachium rosenbergii]|uniref:uncharacterized protein n=1 Tax=Macrobrachium rosenbergii TaxID=79674 RepID=UPI0034D5D830